MSMEGARMSTTNTNKELRYQNSSGTQNDKQEKHQKSLGPSQSPSHPIPTPANDVYFVS